MDGIYNLGRAYYHGIGGERNYNEALNLFQRAAAGGYMLSVIGMADTYYFGLKDAAKAFEFYKQALKTETAWVLYMVGQIYYFGQGGQAKDYVLAMQYFKKAAEKGNVPAMNFIGVMYKSGFGVAIDKETAAYWYTKAAEGGDYYAMGNLAIMLEQGDGIKRDKKAAKEWIEKQAKAIKY